jgi:hypothetical protein
LSCGTGISRVSKLPNYFQPLRFLRDDHNSNHSRLIGSIGLEMKDTKCSEEYKDCWKQTSKVLVKFNDRKNYHQRYSSTKHHASPRPLDTGLLCMLHRRCIHAALCAMQSGSGSQR